MAISSNHLALFCYFASTVISLTVRASKCVEEQVHRIPHAGVWLLEKMLTELARLSQLETMCALVIE